MTTSSRPRRQSSRISRMCAAVMAFIMLLTVAACAGQDPRTTITVWSWEPSMGKLAQAFEAANPDIRVIVKDTSGYENLNTAIQDGYGLPDVAQIEYYALPQYAVSGQLRDMTSTVESYGNFYTAGTWSSIQLGGRMYGLPMDSGPMAFFYNDSVFRQAGVDPTTIRTWEDYYRAAKKLKNIGVYIAADAGDASFFDAMIWLAGGRPFHTSSDGKTVTVDLKGDAGVRTFIEYWQKMMDEGLINTRLSTWSNGWKRALGSGSVASVLSGAWMPSMLLSDVPGAAGQWRVGTMPTVDGSVTNAEIGGSALTMLNTTRKPEAAYRFINYVCHDAEGIATRVDGGAFPADITTLQSAAFLDKTTIRDSRGIQIPYFGGQQFNKVLAKAADNVSPDYQYLPFEVYARGDFRATMGKAYKWESANQRRIIAKKRYKAGMTDDDGNPVTVPADPGPKVSLAGALASWQKDIKEYGANQGFTIQ